MGHISSGELSRLVNYISNDAPAVPEVLNNIALVVVGFYFGKRKTADEG